MESALGRESGRLNLHQGSNFPTVGEGQFFKGDNVFGFERLGPGKVGI